MRKLPIEVMKRSFSVCKNNSTVVTLDDFQAKVRFFIRDFDPIKLGYDSFEESVNHTGEYIVITINEIKTVMPFIEMVRSALQHINNTTEEKV